MRRRAETDSWSNRVRCNSPQEFAAQIEAEFKVYKNVVDTAKLRLD